MAKVKIGDVWDRTTEFLGDCLTLVLPLALVAMFVPTTVMASLSELRPTAPVWLAWVLVLLQIVFAILALWAQLAITALAIDPALKGRMREAATQRLLPAIAVCVPPFLIVAIILGVQFFVFARMSGIDLAQLSAGQVNVAQLNPPAGTVLFFALLMIVETVALLLLLARLLPLTAVVVAERRRLGAYARTLQLTRGMTWKLVGVLFLYGGVAWVASRAATTVFGLILWIVAPTDGTISVASVLTATVAAAVDTGFAVLASVFCAKLYVACARRADLPLNDPA